MHLGRIPIIFPNITTQILMFNAAMFNAAPDELKEAARLFPAVKVLVKFHLGLLIPFFGLFALLFKFYGLAVFTLSVFLGISLVVSAVKDWRDWKDFGGAVRCEKSHEHLIHKKLIHQLIHRIWNLLALPGQGMDLLLDRLAEEFAVRISRSAKKVALSPVYLRSELLKLAEEMGWQYSSGRVEGEGEVVKLVIVDRPSGLTFASSPRKCSIRPEK